jgi:hypothetical protein
MPLNPAAQVDQEDGQPSVFFFTSAAAVRASQQHEVECCTREIHTFCPTT